jgi:hypothetical protein
VKRALVAEITKQDGFCLAERLLAEEEGDS